MRVFVSIALVTGLLALVGAVGATPADQSLPPAGCTAESQICPGTHHTVFCEGERICISNTYSVECDGIGISCPYVECVPGSSCSSDLDCAMWGVCNHGSCICLAGP